MNEALAEIRIKVDQVTMAWRGARATTDVIGDHDFADAFEELIDDLSDVVRQASEVAA